MQETARPPRILVVEDEALIAVELQERLHALGFATLGPADTAETAVAMAEAERPT
jgi:DNA-binding response OmpR family regulator